MVQGIGLGHLVTRIAGSNPTWGMDVCLCVYMLCCPVSVEAFATS
jgi:F0F1-type ATP synthase assembly protein I